VPSINGKEGESLHYFLLLCIGKKEIELNEYEDAFRPFFFPLQAKKSVAVEVAVLSIIFGLP
jgi:hypothetical protein